MAFTYDSIGTVVYSTAGATSLAVPYPTTVTVDDLLLMFVGQKPSTANNGTVTADDTGPLGWFLTSNVIEGGYGATLGADTGNTRLRMFHKYALGTETGNTNLTLASNNVTFAVIVRLLKDSRTITGKQTSFRTYAWNGKTTSGNVNINLTDETSNFASRGLIANDPVFVCMVIPTDVTTPAQFTNYGINVAGATFSAITELAEFDSDVGNDIGGFLALATVTSGVNPTPTPNITATVAGTTTNVRGPVQLWTIQVSLKFEPLPGSYGITGNSTSLFHSFNLNAAAGSLSITGNAATTKAGRYVNAAASSYSITGSAGIAKHVRIGSPGTYTYTGSNATTVKGFYTNNVASSYSLTGLATELISTDTPEIINAEPALFSVTGSNAIIRLRAVLNTDTYTISGIDASLSEGTPLSADSGVFSINGLDASLLNNIIIEAASSSYTYTGFDLSANKDNRVSLDAGSYTLAFKSTTKSWLNVTDNNTEGWTP
jgi:hypothetical protein